MRRHSTGRSASRSSLLGHPGGPFRGRRGLELGAGFAVALLLAFFEGDAGAEPEVLGAWIQLAVSGIVAAFGWLADKAVTVALVVWHAMVIVGQAIVRFAIGLGQIFGKVYQLFAQFWSQVLRPLISWVWRNIERLQKWLKDTLGPALKFIENLRRRLLEIYDRYFRPIFDTIELVRRTLQLLAAFRLDWARELDRKLGELEDRLLWPLREALFRLNQVSDWINRIVTLDGLFQRLTLIRSLWEYRADALKVWWRSIHRALTPDEDAAYGKPLPSRPIAAVVDDARAYIVAHDGPDVGRIDEHVADLRLRVR